MTSYAICTECGMKVAVRYAFRHGGRDAMHPRCARNRAGAARRDWESYEGWLRRRIAQRLAAAAYHRRGPKGACRRLQIGYELGCARELRIALKQWRLPG